MPSTRRLYSAGKETRDLEVMMEGTAVNVLSLKDSEATRQSVMAGMRSHGWVHFACHGMQDADQPLMSGLSLCNGRLELLEIMKQQIPNADFAFLSASETSKGDFNLSEEVVHLTAGMLFAGYRGVVGTMWSIPDRDGPAIATEFYQYLLKENGLGGLDSSRAAYALDYATRTFRERWGNRLEMNMELLANRERERVEMNLALLAWVPYVHFGY